MTSFASLRNFRKKEKKRKLRKERERAREKTCLLQKITKKNNDQVDPDAGQWEDPNLRKSSISGGTEGGGDDEGYGGVLTYEWHSKMYLGAAHGVSGILFVLMQGQK